MTPGPSFARDLTPPEGVLQQLRIPFVRRATLVSSARTEEVFLIDIGLTGAFSWGRGLAGGCWRLFRCFGGRRWLRRCTRCMFFL